MATISIIHQMRDAALQKGWCAPGQLLCTMVQKEPAIVTKEIALPSVLMSAKTRTTVEVRSGRRSRLATTALFGLAPARSARASAATTGETSALASMMTQV
jgi:hypothetical protein